MEYQEHPLLHVPDLALALLRASQDHTAGLADALGRLDADRRRAGERPDVPAADVLAGLDLARRHLAAAGLIHMIGPDCFRITPRGRAVLHRHPDGIDDSVLMEFGEFRDWIRSVSRRPPPEDSRPREFLRGWSAMAEGRELDDNPFPPDTAQHAAWEDGWLEASRRGREGA